MNGWRGFADHMRSRGDDVIPPRFSHSVHERAGRASDKKNKVTDLSKRTSVLCHHQARAVDLPTVLYISNILSGNLQLNNFISDLNI